jgi:hypothetical protein
MIRRMTVPASVAPTKSSIARTLSWAVYLGMSWTWCIGMFLPVILVSEFGVSMWFVFAIPNVVGAAAMGWVLKTPGSSERIVAEHHGACVAFSSVTIAFQLFFLFWMSQIGLIAPDAAISAVVAGLGAAWIARRKSVVDLAVGWIVFGVAAAVLVRALQHPQITDIHGVIPERTLSAWLGVGPVCVLGFLLCPYLDVTFHRARQALTPGPAKLAFGLGFGLFFLAMIVLTLLYVGDFSGHGGSFVVGEIDSESLRTLTLWIGSYMAMQIGFTLAVHLRASSGFRWSDAIWWIGGAVLLLAGVLVVLKNQHLEPPGLQQDDGLLERQMSGGEFMYRMFMSFYGLVFPAYVWVCVIPWRKDRGTGWGALIACAIVVLVAAPFFWIGFMLERMFWLLPAVGIVLVGGPLRRVLSLGSAAKKFNCRGR